MLTKFWSGYMKERDNLRDLGVHENTVLKYILNKCIFRT
jgi:hypothetical protein